MIAYRPETMNSDKNETSSLPNVGFVLIDENEAIRLLDAIKGVDSGKDILSIDGKDVASMPPEERARNIALADEKYAPLLNVSILENVTLSYQSSTRVTPEECSRGMKALEAVGLEGKAGCLPYRFGLETQRMVRLARALAQETPVLLIHFDLEEEEERRMATLLRPLANCRLILFTCRNVSSLREEKGLVLASIEKAAAAPSPQKTENSDLSSKGQRGKKHLWRPISIGLRTLNKSLSTIAALFLVAFSFSFGAFVVNTVSFDQSDAMSQLIQKRDIPHFAKEGNVSEEILEKVDAIDSGRNHLAFLNDAFAYPDPLSEYPLLTVALYNDDLFFPKDEQSDQSRIVSGRKPLFENDVLISYSLMKEFRQNGFYNPLTNEQTYPTEKEIIGLPLFPSAIDRYYSRKDQEPFLICGVLSEVASRDDFLRADCYVSEAGKEWLKTEFSTKFYCDEFDSAQPFAAYDENGYHLFFEEGKTTLLPGEVLVGLSSSFYPRLFEAYEEPLKMEISAENSANGVREFYTDSYLFFEALYNNAASYVANRYWEEAFRDQSFPIDSEAETYYAKQGLEVPETLPESVKPKIYASYLLDRFQDRQYYTPHFSELVNVYWACLLDSVDGLTARKPFMEVEASRSLPPLKVVGFSLMVNPDRRPYSNDYDRSFTLSEEDLRAMGMHPQNSSIRFDVPYDSNRLLSLLKATESLEFSGGDSASRALFYLHGSESDILYSTLGHLPIVLQIAIAVLLVLPLALAFARTYQDAKQKRQKVETLQSIGWSRSKVFSYFHGSWGLITLAFLLLSVLLHVLGILLFNFYSPLIMPLSFLSLLVPVGGFLLLWLTTFLPALAKRIRKRKAGRN